MLKRAAAEPRTLEAVCRRPVLFIGGKGGVGKTTVAAGLALRSAGAGRRTLLVSTDPAHSTSDALGVRLGPDPLPVAASLWAVEIDPATEADRYIEDVKRRIADTVPPRLAAEVERQFDIARLSPGAEEAAVFERFTRFMDAVGDEYDQVVFDTAPLGHTLRLLTLPEHLQAWVNGLIARRRKVNVLQRVWETMSRTPASPANDTVLEALEGRQQRFARARGVVTDPARAAFVFVVTPEWLPVAETRRALEALERHRIAVGGLVVNRLVGVGDEGALGRERREQQAAVLDAIDRQFTHLPRRHVPEFRGDLRGVDALARVGEVIGRA